MKNRSLCPKPFLSLVKSLSQTVSVISEKQIGRMFPNVTKVFEILLGIPATSTSVERSNSTLRYIKRYILEQHEWASFECSNINVCS